MDFNSSTSCLCMFSTSSLLGSPFCFSAWALNICGHHAKDIGVDLIWETSCGVWAHCLRHHPPKAGPERLLMLNAMRNSSPTKACWTPGIPYCNETCTHCLKAFQLQVLTFDGVANYGDKICSIRQRRSQQAHTNSNCHPELSTQPCRSPIREQLRIAKVIYGQDICMDKPLCIRVNENNLYTRHD